MTLKTILALTLGTALGSTSLAGCTKVYAGELRPVKAYLAFSHALPAQSGPLRADVVDVTYAPGASSRPHTHDCAVVGYVLEGAVRTQSTGQAAATYVAGETFYESPNVVHVVSRNASATRPARFLAYFVCGAKDRD